MIKKSFWTILASMAFAFQSLVTNKLFSMYFGPQGVTILAHFQNIIAIFTTIPNDGINRGVIRFLADGTIDNKQWKQYFNAAIYLNLAAFMAGIILMASFYATLVDNFPNYFFSLSNIALILLGIFLHIVNLFLVNLFLAASHIRAFSIFSVLNNLLGLVLIWFGINQGLNAGLAFLSFAPATMLIFMLIYFANTNKKRFEDYDFTTQKVALQQMGSFILAAISSVVLSKIIDFFVRAYVIDQFQLYQTGLWQGVVKISDGYSSIFNAAFGMLFFVKISSIIHEPIELKIYVRKSIAVIIGLSAVGLLSIWLFKSQLLVLLYNKDFVTAGRFLDFQLLGDLFKFPSWILSFLLLTQLKTTQYIFTQCFSALIYCLLVFILVPLMGIEGLPMAHFLRFVCYLSIMIVLTRKIIF